MKDLNNQHLNEQLFIEHDQDGPETMGQTFLAGTAFAALMTVLVAGLIMIYSVINGGA